MKLNDWVKDDIYGYWQVVDVTAQYTVLKNCFNKDSVFRRNLSRENTFRYKYYNDSDYEAVSADEETNIQQYLLSNPSDLQKMTHFTEKYLAFAQRILDTGLREASWRPGHFFRHCTDKTAFFVNLNDLGDYMEVVYGFASTAYMAGDEEWFDRHGADDDDANLRFSLKIECDADEAVACERIKKVFEEYRNVEKDALLDVVKAKRKAFFQKITDRLKPLGFKKKASKWRKNLTERFVLEFYAQKSAFSDQYYFNIAVYDSDIVYPECYGTRIFKNESCIHDWQLLSDQDFDEIMNRALETILLPIIRTPLDELGKNPMIWEACTCKRTKCPSCWVEKNIWEVQEDGLGQTKNQ